MPGKVYCFNCYNETMNQLNVNGLSAGSIGGWSSSGSAIYTAVAVAVNRARHSDGSQPVFSNDQPTALRLNWDSFAIQTQISLVGLPNVSLDDDLILYIAVNQLTLVSSRGFVLLSQPISPFANSDVAQKTLQSLARPQFHRD
ncbi:MAG TPA: hypothetical protein VGF77_04955 [Allosphingosinicella sp.]